MLRNMVLLGTAIGVAVAFPIIYEAKRDVIHDVLRGTPAPDHVSADADATATLSLAKQASRDRQSDSLAGRVVRLQSDQQGHFTGSFRFNGHHLDALIDTGATYVAMNRSSARRIGIDLQPEDFRFTVNTANGSTQAAMALIARLELGRIILEDVETLVLDDRSLKGTLVGVNFLNRLSRYSVEAGTLVMEQ